VFNHAGETVDQEPDTFNGGGKRDYLVRARSVRSYDLFQFDHDAAIARLIFRNNRSVRVSVGRDRECIGITGGGQSFWRNALFQQEPYDGCGARGR
jgi:hypothetical protein